MGSATCRCRDSTASTLRWERHLLTRIVECHLVERLLGHERSSRSTSTSTSRISCSGRVLLDAALQRLVHAHEAARRVGQRPAHELDQYSAKILAVNHARLAVDFAQ